MAPDSFGGTFAAFEVAAALARGLRAGGRPALELPVADGGEGTLEVVLAAVGAEERSATVSDPLGRPVEARFALLPGCRVALVEAAQASGLRLVAPEERDPWRASTRGTGELIAAAAAAGAGTVVVAAGGSATTDGGAGALAALDEAGAYPTLEVVCDVRTPWEDAARVFGPQKGADARTVARLERRMDKLAASAPRDPRGVALGGCAGGLSGGLWAHRGARLLPGAAWVLEAIGFDARMRAARFVVTGEGRLDAQTMAGKVVAEVATRCRQSGVACHAVVGVAQLDPFALRVLDLAGVTEATTVAQLEAAGRALALS